MVVALGIAVAAPLHALAMPQPCAQMTEDGPVTGSAEQAGKPAGQAGGGDPGDNWWGVTGPLASVDCAQHCSALGDADPVFGSLRHLADTPPAGGTPPLTLVFPELDPSPPRSGVAA
jgi:hypothetical protein